MKKWLAIIALSLMCQAQASNISKEELTSGRWLCFGDYSNLHIITVDDYEYHADGSSQSRGAVIASFDDANTILSYAVEKTGRWTLKDDVLNEVVRTHSVKRAHPNRTNELIKRNAEVAMLDRAIYTILTQDGKTDADNTISLKIIRINNNQFNVQNLAPDGSPTRMIGQCQRAPEDAEENSKQPENVSH